MLQKILREKKVFVIISVVILLCCIAIWGKLTAKANAETQNAKAQSVITSQNAIALVSEETLKNMVYSVGNTKEVTYGKFYCRLKYNHVKEIVDAQDSKLVTLEEDKSKDGNLSQSYLNIYRDDNWLLESYREKEWKEDASIYEICHYSKSIDSESVDVYKISKKNVSQKIFVVCYFDEAYLIETDYVFTCGGILDCVDIDEYLVESYRSFLIDGCGRDGEALCVEGIFRDSEQIYEIGPNQSGMEQSINIEFEKEEYLYKNKVIVQQNKEVIQEFSWESNGKYDPWFGDFNNDQYADIALNCMPGVKNDDYCLYLWNEDIKQYEKFQCETNLPYFEVYEDGIKVWYNDTYASKIMVTYKWNGIVLEKVSEKKIFAIVDIYQNLSMKQNAKKMSLIYLDEDSTPELLLLIAGEYKLYTFDDGEVKEIIMPSAEIKANAYGPRHNFEDSDDLMFYWFEYVPYKGLIRVHGGSEEERYDYYLKYENGSFVKKLKTESKDYKWHTYAYEKEVDSKVFLEQMETLGYDELVPCAYLYEDVSSAYENIDRETDTQKVLDDFVSGKNDAMCYVEEITDIPEDGFVMSSFDELYEYMIAGDELWGSLEYTDFDNDGEEELIICGYTGSKMFLDVIGDTVYILLHTGGTADVASVAEIENTRVIERTDLTHGGRQYYEIMQYDACGCLVERFGLLASFEGDHYTESDRFKYNGEVITMEEFEAMVDSIERVDSDTARSFSSKYHIEIDNKIYFRQYSSDSILEGDVLGYYSEVKSAPKRFVSLDEDGKLADVFEDNGYGSIYLLEGRLFSQCMTQDGSRVYSCDLTGKNKTMWSSWEILDQAEDGFLICKTSNDGLAVIDSIEEKIVVEEAVQYQGCFDNIIYYSIQKKDTVELHSVDSEGNKKQIITVSVKDVTSKGSYDSNTINIGGLDVCGEYMAFAAGDYQSYGSYYGGVIALCKLDGIEKTLFYSESSSHSFYNEGKKTAFLYEQDEEVKWEELSVEMLETFKRIPTYGVLDAYHSVSGYIMHSDWKETYLYENEYEELLAEIEKAQKYQYDYHEIKNAEILGNKLFFNIVLEKADPSKDIGWRAYYERVATYEYVKDLGTGEIRLLYVF